MLTETGGAPAVEAVEAEEEKAAIAAMTQSPRGTTFSASRRTHRRTRRITGSAAFATRCAYRVCVLIMCSMLVLYHQQVKEQISAQFLMHH